MDDESDIGKTSSNIGREKGDLLCTDEIGVRKI